MRVDLVVVCVAAVAFSFPALSTCDPLYAMLAPNLQTVSSAPSFSPSASNASQSEHVRKTTISGVHPVESMIKVTGYVGKSAEIRCPYDRGYEGHSKYLCRGKCIWGSKDIPIRTEADQTKAINGRFSLHDDTTAGVFTVTITGLSAEDSGQYWCGVTTGFGRYDVFTEVKLNVKKGVHPVESMIKVTGYVGKSAEIRCPYDRGYEGHSKYLCRGRCIWGIKDIPIRTEAGQTKAVNGRFSLHDDATAGVFTVTITGLTAEDSGQYWCGVATGFGSYDVFTEVKLNVKKEACSTLKTGKIDEEKRSNRICHKDTNYVYQVTVEKMSLTHNTDLYHMRIDQVIREGADKVHEGARCEFAGYPTCRDKLALEVGKTYLVIGRREDYKGRLRDKLL
ncbi:polymeric immunoglobulin receptor-like [Alosa pseudoharengus]|uniref:polymeric immunoglobulin receptor-like n=1 Tax=Alosa pseudoharengus TaxID=34774 RepID=UPI003F8B05E7